jgi:hypothetical protein
MAQIAKEQQLQQPVGTNPDGTPFTLNDLFVQSGLYSTKGAQNQAIKDELIRTNPIAAAYLQAEDAAYRAANPLPKGEASVYAGWTQNQKDAWDAFNNLRSSADYKRYDELVAAETAAGPFGSPAEKAWYAANATELNRLKGVIAQAEQDIVNRTGVNPKQVANEMQTALGKPATYADTTLTKPPSTGTGTSGTSSQKGGSSYKTPYTSKTSSYRPYTTSKSGSSARGGGSGSTGSSAASTAGNDFFDFYRTLTDKADKAAVLNALDKAGVNPIGQKGVTAETFTQALSVAKKALADHQLFGSTTGAKSTTAPTSTTSTNTPTSSNRVGMTKAEALAAMDAIEAAYRARTGGGGLPTAPTKPTPLAQTGGTGLPTIGTTPKAPAGYYYNKTTGALTKSKFAA